MLTKTSLLLLSLLSVAWAGTLMEEIKAAGASTAVDLLTATGLDKAIGTDYLTIFAPSNQAFADLPEDLTKLLTSNTSVLSGILMFHATRGIFRSQDAFNDMMLDTRLTDSKIRVNVYGDVGNQLFITLNGARVMKSNILASNGLLHIIDKVMLPPVGSFYDLISMSKNHTMLKKLIDDTGLRTSVETYTGTFLAPTDDAFTQFFTALADRGMDTATSNIHKEIALYHFVGTVVYSAGVKAGTYATLNHGARVTITINDETNAVKIDQASVLMDDIPATNGVLHIIDSVLIPEPYATSFVMGLGK